MNPHGIDIFNKADGDHLVFGVAHHLQLQLFPSQDRFFHQHLVHEADREPARRNRAELFNVVDQSAACAAHGIRRPDDDGVAEFFSLTFSSFHRGDNLAAGHVNAQPGHGFLESQAVFTAFDGVDIDADDLDAIFL